MFREEAEGLAKKLRIRLYRASVKEDLNVSDGKYTPLCFVRIKLEKRYGAGQMRFCFRRNLRICFLLSIASSFRRWLKNWSDVNDPLEISLIQIMRVSFRTNMSRKMIIHFYVSSVWLSSEEISRHAEITSSWRTNSNRWVAYSLGSVQFSIFFNEVFFKLIYGDTKHVLSTIIATFKLFANLLTTLCT